MKKSLVHVGFQFNRSWSAPGFCGFRYEESMFVAMAVRTGVQSAKAVWCMRRLGSADSTAAH